MKMRKLLATGVAATVAVTSLATVASAAEKSWSMGQTYGTINLSASAGLELGTKYLLTQEQIDAGETLGISNNDKIIVTVNEGDADAVTGVSLKVTGVKGSRNSTSQTYEYAFTNYSDAACTSQTYGTWGAYWALDAYAGSAPVNAFLPEQFVEITKIEISVTGTTTVDTAAEYDAWGSTVWGSYNAATLSVVQAFTAGGVLEEINAAISGMWGYGYGGSKSTSDVYPYIATKYSIVDGARVILRHDVQVLSYTDDYYSQSGSEVPGYVYEDGNQSYEGDDTTAGTNPKDFAGLASQVAEFFNKQLNGTITFKFTTAAGASAGTNWNNGGIPSTQTGIKNFLGGASANDFALFINYWQTGSLQATTTIDAEAGEVIFDISDILDALGGQTIGVIENIYFGLAKGLDYGDGVHTDGLYVEEVILAYDEDEAGDIDIEDDTDDEDDVDADDDVDDEDDVDADDDVDFEDDDVDADDADDEDDANVGGDTNVVTPSEDDDSNPNTGVALAVVPALVAAAAVVASKKRS